MSTIIKAAAVEISGDGSCSVCGIGSSQQSREANADLEAAHESFDASKFRTCV